MPAFTPVASYSTFDAPSVLGNPSARSSFKSSPSTSTAPYPMTRRDSTYSNYSTASSEGGWDSSSSWSDTEEVTTPEASPELKAHDAKGKGKAVDLGSSLHSFSLSGIHGHDDGWAIPIVPTSTASIFVPPPTPSPRSAPLPLAPADFLTPPVPSPAPVARPAPSSPPTTAPSSADDSRGRSRWPRLLWRSELDIDSLTVLRDYHQRAVGEPLPILSRGMGTREVGRWSRKMEDAGL
ncbi:hypothetical protein JCM11641_007408 [Rhodosporidiobolus odoratus]